MKPLISMLNMALVLCLLGVPLLATPVSAAPDARSAPATSSTQPKATPPSTPAPAADTIPVPEVARRAEEVGKLLREIDALAGPDYFTDSVEKRLPDVSTRIARQL